MKTSSYSPDKVKQKLADFFDKRHINKVSKKTGFIVRQCKKIPAYEFVTSLIFCFLGKQNTFSAWARHISEQTGESVSKQALFKKMGASTTAFCKQLLEDALLKKTKALKGSNVFKSFKKVLLQDSTTFKLAACLKAIFPGNHSGGVQKAVMRIQTLLDIKTMQFIHFSISGFNRNDQAASGDVLAFCSKGDLVIRDLGYFSLKVFDKIKASGADLLSRLRFGVNLYDLDGKEIVLKTLLKAGQKVDMQVLVGEHRVPMRLVLLPMPKDKVAERKRKANTDRDKRLNHSRLYYKWLEFSAYITTVNEGVWTTENVGEAYSTRWQIEIVFKSWKSGGTHLPQLLHERCTNAERVKACIYLMLLFITLFSQNIYLPILKKMVAREQEKVVSLLKLFAWVCSNLVKIICLTEAQLIKKALEICPYDKRNDRQSLMAKIIKR